MPWVLFRDRAFALPNLVGFLYSGALFGCLYLMGLFFQNARHATRWTPICNPVIMTTCLLLAGAATLLLIGIDVQTPYWHLAIANSGAGLVTASMTAATVAAAGDQPEGHLTVYLNPDYMVDHMFWQYAAVLFDRFHAQRFAETIYTEPAQLVRLSEERAGLMMPWLDELVALSIDGPVPERFYPIQARNLLHKSPAEPWA